MGSDNELAPNKRQDIGPDDGTAPHRRQAIIWTKDDQVYLCINAFVDLNLTSRLNCWKEYSEAFMNDSTLKMTTQLASGLTAHTTTHLNIPWELKIENIDLPRLSCRGFSVSFTNSR